MPLVLLTGPLRADNGDHHDSPHSETLMVMASKGLVHSHKEC